MHLDQPLISRVMASIGSVLLNSFSDCIKLRLVSLKTHQNARSKIVDYTHIVQIPQSRANITVVWGVGSISLPKARFTFIEIEI